MGSASKSWKWVRIAANLLDCGPVFSAGEAMLHTSFKQRDRWQLFLYLREIQL
jgi:hypothetical protein